MFIDYQLFNRSLKKWKDMLAHLEGLCIPICVLLATLKFLLSLGCKILKPFMDPEDDVPVCRHY